MKTQLFANTSHSLTSSLLINQFFDTNTPKIFNCMLFSCHVRVSEWIYTLQLPECQGTPCSKQARNLKFKWLQLESNPEPLISETNTQPFGQTGETIELRLSNYLYGVFDCMFLSRHARLSEWIYTLYCLNVKEILPQSRREIWSLSDCD